MTQELNTSHNRSRTTSQSFAWDAEAIQRLLGLRLTAFFSLTVHHLVELEGMFRSLTQHAKVATRML
jgi:hypothetical protein